MPIIHLKNFNRTGMSNGTTCTRELTVISNENYGMQPIKVLNNLDLPLSPQFDYDLALWYPDGARAKGVKLHADEMRSLYETLKEDIKDARPFEVRYPRKNWIDLGPNCVINSQKSYLLADGGHLLTADAKITVIKWAHNEPKYDLRWWNNNSPDQGRGITLTQADARNLVCYIEFLIEKLNKLEMTENMVVVERFDELILFDKVILTDGNKSRSAVVVDLLNKDTDSEAIKLKFDDNKASSIMLAREIIPFGKIRKILVKEYNESVFHRILRKIEKL